MLYTAVRDNIPLNIIQNIDTFYNNNFSTAVGYVSTKMGREHIRHVKKPYATTNIYNPGAHPLVVPLYTNPLQIGKLLQLQQWPNCLQVGGVCHQPHILCKPDMVIVLEEIQFQPPAQAQVAGQAPPGGPGGPAQAPAGPPGGGVPPAGGPSTSGQGAAQQGNNDDDDDDDDEEPEEDDDPYALDYEYPEEDDDDNGNYEHDEEEEEESTDDSQDDRDEYDDIYDDDNDHNDDVCAPGEYHDDNNDPNDETNLHQKRKCESPLKEAKKRKTGESSMPLREHEERVETIVDVPREHEMEQIPQEESLLSPELTTPHQSCVQDTPPRRHSPRIKNQTITEPIPATPLEFVHPGIENMAARIETPQNPSSEWIQRISRKLILGTPLGTNPQQSTSTGGENVKTIPGKGAPKTGRHGCGRGVPFGRGAPSGHGRGPAPTGAHAPVPGVVTCAAAAAVAGGGGGGVGAPVVPVPNAEYIYRSPLVIIEIEGKKVSFDHNKYVSKAFCAMACGLAFAPQGYIVHVFPHKVDVISTFWDVNDMTIKCEAERINMQRDDQNLATQFDTLTDRLVEILVKQLMTTVTTANLSFAQKQILGLKYHSDAKMRHGLACLNCFHCPTLNSVRAANQDAAVLATPYETF